MDIESNRPPQGGPARPAPGGWKALGLHAAVLACVAVAAFYGGRLVPSRVACFAGGAPEIGGAAGELVANEVAAAMADPDVRLRLERIAEDMAATPGFQAHMERGVAGMQAAMLGADFQERVNDLASRISDALRRAGPGGPQSSSGMASYLKRFVATPGALPTRSRSGSATAAAAGPTMQGAAPENMAGVTAPLGFFDPFGYTKEGNYPNTVSEGRLRFLRESELKNGRIAMLAALGFVVAEQYPVFFRGQFNGPSIKTWTQIGLEGNFWPGVIMLIAIPEVFSLFNYNNPLEGGEFRTFNKTDGVPGNYFNFDPLGLMPKDPKALLSVQNKEINNGRLAMLGISGMVAQELVNGQKIVDTLQQKLR